MALTISRISHFRCRPQGLAAGRNGDTISHSAWRCWAWFKKCHFQVTPEIDRALIVRGFLVLGVTLI